MIFFFLLWHFVQYFEPDDEDDEFELLTDEEDEEEDELLERREYFFSLFIFIELFFLRESDVLLFSGLRKFEAMSPVGSTMSRQPSTTLLSIAFMASRTSYLSANNYYYEIFTMNA